jgi:serine/threonine-protein kinase
MEQTKKRRREGEILKGKYRLDRHIATGGMGEVYQATNLALGRTVAVKLLLDQFLSDQNSIKRFLLEARAASMVQHENIVQVFDIDETESGMPFIVQEFLRGETLSRRIRRTGEGIPAEELLDILIPVVEAIGEAHKAGIVHRDIKPSNIFLTKVEKGVIAKVLDFGISRIASATDDVRLTKTTAVLGSPAYMSPEQIQSSRNATTRSDVWSIGAMMYELLSGELPFKGKTSSEIMVNVCSQEPVSLHESAPGISMGLAEVVHRCLSRRPDQRYLDGESLAKALREVREKEYRSKPAVFPTPTERPSTRSVFDIQESSVAGVDSPSVFNVTTGSTSPTEGSTGTTTDRHADTGTYERSRPEAQRHPSYGDIPSIVSAFLILGGVLLVSAMFTPGDIAERVDDITGITQVAQLLFAGGVFYLARLVGYKAGQFSGTGSTVALVGLYGVGATLLLLSGAVFLDERAILPVLVSIMSISVALTSLGFTIVGFEYVKDQLVTDNLITPPGVAVVVLALVSAVIGFQYLTRVVG